MEPDWSNILPDILEYIQKKLALADILRLRAVCRAWRSATLSHISFSLNCPPPISLQQPLLIWDDNYEGCEYSYSFLDVTKAEKNLYHLNIKTKLLLGLYMGACVGYSHGWFIFLDKKRRNRLRLFHPLLFPAAAARFPPISTPGGKLRGRIEKAVLWADPVSARGGNYGVVVIHESDKRWQRRLLYAKCGSTRFMRLGNLCGMDEIICINNCVYGITRPDRYGNLHVVAWDFSGEEKDAMPKMLFYFQFKLMSNNAVDSSFSTILFSYLVESEGELLLVSIKQPETEKLRLIEESQGIGFSELYIHARSPNMCRVYKMDSKQKKWVEMDSLGDRVLFITFYQTISLSTREFPQYVKNSIYFDYSINIEGCKPVIGVFNLDDGSMKEIDIKR